MKYFFDQLYYFTNSMYSMQLDNYLYAIVPGYLHIGLVMLLVSLIICTIFYYMFAPVRKQLFWWAMFVAFNGVINFLIALYYTCHPLMKNEIEFEKAWSYLDCFMFGVTDFFWSAVFFTIISLIIKWGSTAKYVPFKVF